MCEELSIPPGGSAAVSGGFNLDTLQRDVGSIVRVLCANRTVAVLECKPDGHWNGTVPLCDTSGTGGNDHHDGISNMGTILIVVWVLGGILLFTLLILITIIISSRKKPTRRVNGQQPTTVFQISGQEGGDNPAFSRSEERTGSTARLSAYESDGNGRSDRLPSYQEAVMGGYIQPPPIGNSDDSPYFIRVNAPPSYRTSQLNRPTSGAQTTAGQQTAASVTSISEAASPRVVQATIHSTITPSRQQESNSSERTTCHHRSEWPTTPLPPINAVSSPSSTSSSSSSAAAVSSETLLQPNQASQRYVESFPGCFWEEDPPPPYTPGPSNMRLYRSPSRNAHHRRSLPPRPRQRQPDFSNATTIPPHTHPSSSTGSTAQVNSNSTSTTIPTAPRITSTSQSQDSNMMPHSGSQISYSSSSSNPTTMSHYSTINVAGNGYQQQMGNFGVHPSQHHNPTIFANRTTAVHQHQVPLRQQQHDAVGYGHNRSQSHGNSNLTSCNNQANLQQQQHAQNTSLQQHPLYQTGHSRQGSAPIARLEVEYF